MKTTFLTGFLLMCACTLAAQSQPNTKTISVEVTNSWSKDKSDAPVVLKIKDLQPGFRVRSAVVMNGSEEIPSQLDDLNGDLKADELAFVMDIPAQSKKTLAITLSSAQADKTYPARVFAEMLIRDAKKQKHAPTQSVTVPGTTNFYNMLHGHGPMFESELVAYRVYFNQKQTVDPYGKFKKGLEIKESGFYPNDEQLARGFGDRSEPYVAIGVPVAMALTAWAKKDKGLLKDAVYVGTSVAGAFVVAYGMKYLVDRERPYERYPDR